MVSDSPLSLDRHQVADLLDANECVMAAERAFQLHGEGSVPPPGILGFHGTNGGFHVKAALLTQEQEYFVAKINANFPQNIKTGFPTIRGLIVVMDGKNGQVLAVMDSIEITIQRTAAATALAARYLSRTDSKTITICGCGNQGRRV